MANFGERHGGISPRSVMQTDALDDETRIELWNVLFNAKEFFNSEYSHMQNRTSRGVATYIWRTHLAQPIDAFDADVAWAIVRKKLLTGSFVETLWMVEEFVKGVGETTTSADAKTIARGYNTVLERHLVGYRFVDLELAPVSSEVEVAEIEAAFDATERFSGARKHLQHALGMLSSKDAANYAKAVAESVLAVEAIVRYLTGEKTLGAGLRVLSKSGFPAHPSLIAGWDKLYGYSNDGDGIRHGSIRDSDVDESLATYFVVSSSAFVNLLLKVSVEKDDDAD